MTPEINFLLRRKQEILERFEEVTKIEKEEGLKSFASWMLIGELVSIGELVKFMKQTETCIQN